MPRLSLGVSTNSGSNRAAVAPAPSGFPNVGANGQQIYVSGYYEYTGIYTKVSSGYEVGFVAASRVYNGPYIINGDFFAQLIFNTSVNRWEFGGVADWTGNGYEWLAVISNPSSNQNVIPTSGWSPSITITAAAPSGIPVASTNSINLVDTDNSYQNGNYPKTNVGTFTDDIGVTTTNQYGIDMNGSLSSGYPYILFNITANRWELGSYESYGDGGLAWFLNGGNTASNPSSNQNYIPTTGWSRNITITAA